MAVGTTSRQAKPRKSLPTKLTAKSVSKRSPVKSTTRKKVAPQKVTVKKLPTKASFGFPTKPSTSKYPSTMSESQKKKESGRSSHRERVLMRAMLRKSGAIPRDAPNEVGDRWLQSHGYLHGKGYDPGAKRVSQLSKALGFKRRPTPKQLGIT